MSGAAEPAAPGATIHARVMLSRAVYSCIRPDGQRGVEMHFAKDANGLFPEGLRARWLGPQAALFLDQHRGDLRPGRALDVAFYHIKSRDNETRALIAACQLAPLPPSWLKHIEKTQTQEQHA